MNRHRLLKRRLGLESLEIRQLLAADLPEYFDYIDENGELAGGRLLPPQPAPAPASEQSATPLAAPPNAPPSNWETIVNNGPSSNRIDLVFVGDGYRTADLPAYRQHVAAVVPSFFAEAPLDAYASFFNIHRVDVVSTDSGVDNDPSQGVLRSTALDMGFWCGGTERLLCIDTFKASVAASNAPAVDQILAVANSTKYGGAGYEGNNLGTLSGNNGSAVELALHEFGHSFADLADEYGSSGTYFGGEPAAANVSTHNASYIAANQVKWHHWLDLPEVDAFEGGLYVTQGIYRPTANSKMRSLGQPFGPVNTEAFIRSMYQTVRPIDSATPAGTYGESFVFEVDPVDPASHALTVAWSIDGEPVVGEAGTSLDAASLGLAPGSYDVGVRVVDETPLVRDEALRDSLMTDERHWTLVVSSPPALVGPRIDTSSIAPGATIPVAQPVTLTTHFTEGLDQATLDVSDAVLVGATTGPRASTGFTYNAAQQTLTINYGTLPADSYTLTFASGATGFRNAAGDALDGELSNAGTFPTGDGVPGGDFVLRFGVANRTLSLPNVDSGAGGIAALPITLDNLTGVRAIDMEIGYNTTVLDVAPADITLGAATANFNFEVSVDDTAGRIRVSIFGDGPLSSGSGTVLNINFHVAANAPGGSYPWQIISAELNEGVVPSLVSTGSLRLGRVVPFVISHQVGVDTIDINLSFDPNLTVLNLYDGQDLTVDQPDLTVIGATGPVAGSFSYNSALRRLTFIKTGGPFAPGNYTLTLASRADGFVTTDGQLLDGEHDFIDGGDYVAPFTVAAVTTPVLGLPDFARGPGQTVNVPNTLASGGLPIRVSNSAGVTLVDVTLNYDPRYLNVTGARLPAELSGAGWTIEPLERPSASQVRIIASGPALASGGRILALLDANVPTSATRGASQRLTLTSITLTAGANPLAVTSESSVHAVAYFGDTSGDGSFSGLDASLVARLAVALDRGLDAYAGIDPMIIADVTGDGALSGLDASYVARKAVGLVQNEIPAIPPRPAPLAMGPPLPSGEVSNSPLAAASDSNAGNSSVASITSPAVDLSLAPLASGQSTSGSQSDGNDAEDGDDDWLDAIAADVLAQRP